MRIIFMLLFKYRLNIFKIKKSRGPFMENTIVTIDQQHNRSNRSLRLFKWIDRWVIEGIEKFIIAAGLLVLSTIVVGTVITRYFFGYSPDWSDELPRFIVIWVTFIGMSYCVRKGEHVVIDVLLNKLKVKLKKYLAMFILILCFLSFIYMTFIGYEMAKNIFATNQKSVTLGISMGYVYMAVPVGCLLTAKNFLHIIFKNLFSKGIYLSLDGRED